MSGDLCVPITITVNGQAITREVDPRVLLANFLRDDLGFTGTHVGCDTSQCGACTVLVNGEAVKSCTVLAVQAQSSSIITVEGLADGNDLHPVQEAFREKHGLQCGFCTPGVMMTAAYLLKTSPSPTSEEIRTALDGVICRCTGYETIVRSIAHAAHIMAQRSEDTVAERDVVKPTR